MEKNYGIELLRICSMLLIIVLHVLGCGGVLNASEGTSGYAISWLLETIAYCSVNCYALISGFVSYSETTKKRKYYKYVENWLQVVFYGLLITCILWKFDIVELNIKLIIKALFPVTFNQYWYFTAYTGVYFLIPFFNKGITALDKQFSLRLLVILFAFFSVFSVWASIFSESLQLNYGYSFLWVAIMYLFGAIIRKYEIHKVIQKSYLLFVVSVCVFVSWGAKVFIDPKLNQIVEMDLLSRLLVTYISPTIVVIAFCLLLLFANMKIPSGLQKIISYIASSTFGVYLLHVQPILFATVLYGRFSWIGMTNPILLPIFVASVALGIFVICTSIDKLREILFKTLKISSILNRLEQRIEKIYFEYEEKMLYHIQEKIERK